MISKYEVIIRSNGDKVYVCPRCAGATKRPNKKYCAFCGLLLVIPTDKEEEDER